MEPVFQPISSPILKDLSRGAVRKFKEDWLAYLSLVKQRADLGYKVQPVTLTSCVEPALLQRIAILELEKPDLKFSDDDISKYLFDAVLKPAELSFLRIDGAFSKLRCDTSVVDVRERIGRLFGDALETRRREGWETLVSDKHLSKFIIQALRPASLRSIIEAEVKYGASAAEDSTAVLYRLVLRHAEQLDTYGRLSQDQPLTSNTTSNGQRNQESSRSQPKPVATGEAEGSQPNQRKWRKPPRDGCLKCQGPHWVQDCPKASPSEKEALVNQLRTTRASTSTTSSARLTVPTAEASRTGGVQNTSSQDRGATGTRTSNPGGPAPARPAAIQVVLPATTASEVPGAREYCSVNGRTGLPFVLDTGAHMTVVPEAVFAQVQRAGYTELRHLDPPLELIDGIVVIWSHIATRGSHSR